MNTEVIILGTHSQKTALVTGAGARVGRAIAIELARNHYEVGVYQNREYREPYI